MFGIAGSPDSPILAYTSLVGLVAPFASFFCCWEINLRCFRLRRRFCSSCPLPMRVCVVSMERVCGRSALGLKSRCPFRGGLEGEEGPGVSVSYMVSPGLSVNLHFRQS